MKPKNIQEKFTRYLKMADLALERFFFCWHIENYYINIVATLITLTNNSTEGEKVYLTKSCSIFN